MQSLVFMELLAPVCSLRLFKWYSFQSLSFVHQTLVSLRTGCKKCPSVMLSMFQRVISLTRIGLDVAWFSHSEALLKVVYFYFYQIMWTSIDTRRSLLLLWHRAGRLLLLWSMTFCLCLLQCMRRPSLSSRNLSKTTLSDLFLPFSVYLLVGLALLKENHWFLHIWTCTVSLLNTMCYDWPGYWEYLCYMVVLIFL